MFCDLRGFTAFAETSEPEEVMGILRQYHEALGELIYRHEGTVEHFAGDGVVVLFNDPLPCPDPSARAVRMAIAHRVHVEPPRSLAQARPRSRLRRRHRPGLRHAGHDRLRGPVRLRGDRPSSATRVAPVRRGRKRRHPHQPARARVDRGSVAGGAGGDLTLKGFVRPVTAYRILHLRLIPPEPEIIGPDPAQSCAAAVSTHGTAQQWQCERQHSGLERLRQHR